MNTSKRFDALFVVLAVLAVVLAVGMLTFAGPCVHDDGSTGKCVAASHAVIGAAVVALVASVAGMAMKAPIAQCVASVIAAIAGLFAAVGPGNILPLCMMQTMRCWTIMRPFAMVVGAAICVIGIVAAVRAVRKR